MFAANEMQFSLGTVMKLIFRGADALTHQFPAWAQLFPNGLFAILVDYEFV